jgi:hypothetical protein
MAALSACTTALHRAARSRRTSLAIALLALFLLLVAVRLWLIQKYITPLPYSDPWDGEAALVLKPWVEGRLHWRDLFAPHNEHRIVPTRLLSLAIFAANHQWDAQLEAAVNAVLWSAFVTLLAAVLVRSYGGRWRWPILVATALYGGLPFGWENTLIGFASQNYFLIMFSLLAIWGLGLHRAGAAGWWAGLLGALLACLSMGSGFMATAAVLGLLILRSLRRRAFPIWQDWVTAAVCTAIVAAGWLLRTVVKGHAGLQADSPRAWFLSFCRYFAWPLYATPWLGLIAGAPIVLLAAAYLRSPRVDASGTGAQRDRQMELLLAVGGWCVLQMATLAYARDAHGAPPSPRYMDLLALFPLANFLAAGLLLTENGQTRRAEQFGVAAAVIWLGTVGWGLRKETVYDLHAWLPWYADAQQRSATNVRGYLLTGDYETFLARKSFPEIPYPSAKRMRDLLDDATIRAFLPSNVRVPLRLRFDPAEDSPFVPHGYAWTMEGPSTVECWGTFPGGRGTTHASVVESSPAARRFPYLEFEFAGDLGDPGTSFTVRDGQSGREVKWHPAHVAHERWRNDYIRRPGADVRLEATDTAPGKWFAFSAPVEVGGWSHAGGYCLRRSVGLMITGVMLACLALGIDLRQLREAR